MASWRTSCSSMTESSSTATTTRMSGKPRRNAAACPICQYSPMHRTCILNGQGQGGAFDAYGVMSVNELEARVEVLHENHASVLAIEARTMLNMVDTQVIPAAARYQSELADTVAGKPLAWIHPRSSIDWPHWWNTRTNCRLQPTIFVLQ